MTLGIDIGTWSILLILVKFCLYMSGFLAIGSAIFLLLFKTAPAQVKHIISISSVVAIVISVAFLLVQVGYIMDDGLTGMFDAEMLQIFLDEKMGTSLYIRVIGLILLLLAVHMKRSFKWVMILPIIMVAGSFAGVGHATGDDIIYTGTLLTLHLVAVSFWFGALYPLYIMAEKPDGAEMLERFGKIASFIVPILLVVGLLFAVNLLGSFAVLFGSSYGVILLIKVAIVGVLLGLATLNKLIFVPQIAATQRQAIVKFKLIVKLEACAFASIFMATALLTTSVAIPE